MGNIKDSEEEKCQTVTEYSTIILFLKHEYAHIYLQALKALHNHILPVQCPGPGSSRNNSGAAPPAATR